MWFILFHRERPKLIFNKKISFLRFHDALFDLIKTITLFFYIWFLNIYPVVKFTNFEIMTWYLFTYAFFIVGSLFCIVGSLFSLIFIIHSRPAVVVLRLRWCSFSLFPTASRPAVVVQSLLFTIGVSGTQEGVHVKSRCVGVKVWIEGLVR